MSLCLTYNELHQEHPPKDRDVVTDPTKSRKFGELIKVSLDFTSNWD